MAHHVVMFDGVMGANVSKTLPLRLEIAEPVRLRPAPLGPQQIAAIPHRLDASFEKAGAPFHCPNADACSVCHGSANASASTDGNATA